MLLVRVTSGDEVQTVTIWGVVHDLVPEQTPKKAPPTPRNVSLKQVLSPEAKAYKREAYEKTFSGDKMKEIFEENKNQTGKNIANTSNAEISRKSETNGPSFWGSLWEATEEYSEESYYDSYSDSVEETP